MEVKNELGPMDKKEIKTKIRMCQQLNLVPVFATRWNAQHSDYISSHGGYNWMFGEQIAPPAQKGLVAKLLSMSSAEGIADEGAQRLRLPLGVGDSLPTGTAMPFAEWLHWADRAYRAGTLEM